MPRSAHSARSQKVRPSASGRGPVARPRAVGASGYRRCRITELAVLSFANVEELWTWLTDRHDTHPGGCVQLQKSGKRPAIDRRPRPVGGRNRLWVEWEHPPRARHDVVPAEVCSPAHCRNGVTAQPCDRRAPPEGGSYDPGRPPRPESIVLVRLAPSLGNEHDEPWSPAPIRRQSGAPVYRICHVSDGEEVSVDCLIRPSGAMGDRGLDG